METLTRALLGIALLALLIAVPRWTRTHDNVTELARLKQDVNELNTAVRDLEMSNARMADHIIALGHSSNARMSRAIHRYDLIRSDEILLRFDEED